MDIKSILSKVDHTLLSQTATWEEIKQICDDGIKYGCASVCIPASYVKDAQNMLTEKFLYARLSVSRTDIPQLRLNVLKQRTRLKTVRKKLTW